MWLLDRIVSFLVTLSELRLDHSLEDSDLIITTTPLNTMSRTISTLRQQVAISRTQYKIHVHRYIGIIIIIIR